MITQTIYLRNRPLRFTKREFKGSIEFVMQTIHEDKKAINNEFSFILTKEQFNQMKDFFVKDVEVII